MILESLASIKVATGVLGAMALSAAAGYRLRSVAPARPGDRYATAALLALLALVVLTRGAPHNNPAVYWIFESHGPLVLLGAVLLSLGGAALSGARSVGSAAALAVIRWLDSEPVTRRCIVGLAGLGMLAAAEPVFRNWDVPGWGDAIFWDRIAHLIARGEMPLGHSYYMPVFQYATALLYWLFGHHFAVQQVANVIWAPVTVVFLCLTARNLGCGNRVVLLVGLLAATHDYLRYTPHVMQIENWYIPMLAIALWAVTRCALRADYRSAALAGLAIGLILSTRAQGAFMCAFLCTAPLWLSRNPWSVRNRQFFVVGLVFVAVLVPWTLRNGAVDGRLAPTSSQGPTHMLLALEPNAFFGIRRDLVRQDFMASWTRRYPDAAVRERAMGRYIIETNLSNPLRFVKGAAWRSLAFYGLLPDGVFAKGGPKATDWRATGRKWLLRNLATLCLLSAAFLGLALARDRRAGFIALAIAGSMAPVFFVGFTEARIHYPTLPLLFLLPALAMSRVQGSVDRQRFWPACGRLWLMLAGAVFGIAVVTANLSGYRQLFQPIGDGALNISQAVVLDDAFPDMSRNFIENKMRSGSHAPAGLPDGVRLRLRVALTKHQLPVKWYAQEIMGFPPFSQQPDSPPFYRAAVVNSDLTYDWGTSPIVAVRLSGAQFDQAPREDDVVDLEGVLITRWESGMAFVDAARARVIGQSRPAAVQLAIEAREGGE